MTHEELMKKAIDAINDIHCDTSVSLEQTLRSLTKLIDLTQMLEEAVRWDIGS